MKKAKFLQDVKLDPARFYRNPADVLRDRRLSDGDRLEIIVAWERSAESGEQTGGFAATAQEQLGKLRALRKQLEHEFVGQDGPERSSEGTSPAPSGRPHTQDF